PAVCILFAFSPLTIYYSAEGRMYSLLWLCLLTTSWVSLLMRERGGGACLFALWVLTSAAGLLTYYFFVFPWAAIVGYLMVRPGMLRLRQLALCVLTTALLILPWYLKLPESLAGWRITKDWLKWRPPHFSLLVVLRDNVFQFFSGHERHLWEGCR